MPSSKILYKVEILGKKNGRVMEPSNIVVDNGVKKMKSNEINDCFSVGTTDLGGYTSGFV